MIDVTAQPYAAIAMTEKAFAKLSKKDKEALGQWNRNSFQSAFDNYLEAV